MKQCKKCMEFKPFEAFSKQNRKKEGLQLYCKLCYRENLKKWRSDNPIQAAKWAREDRLKNPERAKVRDLRHNLKLGTRWGQLKFAAKKRGLEVLLTKEQYIQLTEYPCYYCGGPLPLQGGGVDRIDNVKGYTLGNVVPCCTICNRVKWEFKIEELIEHVDRMKEYLALDIRKLPVFLDDYAIEVTVLEADAQPNTKNVI